MLFENFFFYFGFRATNAVNIRPAFSLGTSTQFSTFSGFVQSAATRLYIKKISHIGLRNVNAL